MLDGLDLEHPGRPLAGHRRAQRRRQDDASSSCSPGCYEPDRRRASPSTASTSRDARRRRLAAPGRRRLPGLRALPALGRATTSPSAPSEHLGDDAAIADARRARGRRATLIDGAARRARTRRCPAQYDGRRRPVRRPVAADRARPGAVRASTAARGVLVLDEPTAALDVRAEAELLRPVPRPDPRASRPSSSRTASPPCAGPTGSSSSTPAGSSSRARHDELVARRRPLRASCSACRPRASPHDATPSGNRGASWRRTLSDLARAGWRGGTAAARRCLAVARLVAAVGGAAAGRARRSRALTDAVARRGRATRVDRWASLVAVLVVAGAHRAGTSRTSSTSSSATLDRLRLRARARSTLVARLGRASSTTSAPTTPTSSSCCATS